MGLWGVRFKFGVPGRLSSSCSSFYCDSSVPLSIVLKSTITMSSWEDSEIEDESHNGVIHNEFGKCSIQAPSTYWCKFGGNLNVRGKIKNHTITTFWGLSVIKGTIALISYYAFFKYPKTTNCYTQKLLQGSQIDPNSVDT